MLGVISNHHEYGITKVTIYSWIDKKKTVQIKDEELTKDDILTLKKRIVELEEENEILKKATAIFAKRR
jgi:transposase